MSFPQNGGQQPVPAEELTPQVAVPVPHPVPASQHVANPTRQFEHYDGRPGRQARDRAQYVRQQKGHSLTLHLIFGVLVLWVNVIYISASPNHYWHA